MEKGVVKVELWWVATIGHGGEVGLWPWVFDPTDSFSENDRLRSRMILHEVREIKIPPNLREDLVVGEVASLRVEQEEVRAKAHVEVRKIQDKIDALLSITYDGSSGEGEGEGEEDDA